MGVTVQSFAVFFHRQGRDCNLSLSCSRKFPFGAKTTNHAFRSASHTGFPRYRISCRHPKSLNDVSKRFGNVPCLSKAVRPYAANGHSRSFLAMSGPSPAVRNAIRLFPHRCASAGFARHAVRAYHRYMPQFSFARQSVPPFSRSKQRANPAGGKTHKSLGRRKRNCLEVHQLTKCFGCRPDIASLKPHAVTAFTRLALTRGYSNAPLRRRCVASTSTLPPSALV